MTQLILRTFIDKGGDHICSRKTEIPTYLQSNASALIAYINQLFFAHFSFPAKYERR
ncbi:hypothetical protein [Maridesulfovibrio sp.]|uniref:hypothetical protein n=1 Tax=Maridesulfovibrio sp. TaxID=2795000 RepID=UPI0029F52AC0|nr:hypothetical protein [Maridesulfovibrio sp.]